MFKPTVRGSSGLVWFGLVRSGLRESLAPNCFVVRETKIDCMLKVLFCRFGVKEGLVLKGIIKACRIRNRE